MDPGTDLEFGRGNLEFGAQLLSIQGPGKAMDSLKFCLCHMLIGHVAKDFGPKAMASLMTQHLYVELFHIH